MGEKIGYILSFMLGGLVGCVVAYKFAYDKAEERADMEIEEMRNYYRKKGKDSEEKSNVIEVAAAKSQQSRNKPSVESLSAVHKTDVPEVNYTMYSEGEPEKAVTTMEPVLLDDIDECGDITHYSRVNLTYYDDLILADDSTMKALSRNEIERAVGLNNLHRLGEKDEQGNVIDQICVRNDRTGTYYSIVRDERDFQEAVGMEDDGEDY